MSKKKKNNDSVEKAFNKKSLTKELLAIFYKNPLNTYNYKQLAKKLDIKDVRTKQLIITSLYELIQDEKLEEVYTGKFKLVAKTSYATGIVDMTSRGGGFVKVPDFVEDVYVSPANLNHALHGDEVSVCLFAKRKKKGLEGEVIEILKEARREFVGTLEIGHAFAFLVPDNRNMPYDIFIPVNKTLGAKSGEKVLAKITEWPKHAKNPVGEVSQVLGKAGEHETEIHAILAEFDLPVAFPPEVEKEANEISEIITEEEIKARWDFRNVTTFTIDPEDAKDFDDALSFCKLENGNYQVGVHIADVTHYVKSRSQLEKEACHRATSVYLVDRVVPMLPERLSNNICSLRPHEDKLTFSAVFEMNEQAEILGQWFGRTIINSNHRFTYQEAQQVIVSKEGTLSEEILTLDKLAKTLRKNRFSNGSISFDRLEMKFHIDPTGKPLDVYFKKAEDSNNLIEEFMLLANRCVAERVGKTKGGRKAKTFVYRVHDEPDLEKLNNFATFIQRFGHQIKMTSPKVIATSINELLDKVEGKTEQNIVENLAVRAMAKAAYSTKNIGHYGLAFPHYTHFTSPIRRYPDMMVHRLLAQYLENGGSASEDKFEQLCKHSTEREILATQAERASTKYKQVEFMKDKVGEVFNGVISGMTDWGLYIELEETRIEGMVSLRDMEDDYYVYDEKNFCITGQRSKRKYQLGDKVRIQIIRANLLRKQLDFKLY